MVCLRSPVFRASILSDMQEGKKGEIFVRDIDEKTLGSIIQFIYTGEVELSEDYDLEMLVYAADKYNLPGINEASLQQDEEGEDQGGDHR